MPRLSDVVLDIGLVEVKLATSHPVRPGTASTVQVIARGLELFVIDDRGCIKHNPSFEQSSPSLRAYWLSQGFQPVALLDFLQVIVKSNPTTSPSTRVDVYNNELRVDATADALRTLTEVIKDLTSNDPLPDENYQPPELHEEGFHNIRDQPKRPLDDDEGFVDDFEDGMDAPGSADAREDVLVVLRLQPPSPRLSAVKQSDVPEVTWLSEDRNIPVIPNYLDNIPPRSDISDIPREFVFIRRCHFVAAVPRIRI
jgi:hypothetical protein